MKKALLGVAMLGMMATFTGCLLKPKAPFEPCAAGFFTETTAPLTTEFHSTPVEGLRYGEASAINILGLIAIGDCGIQAAAKEGNIGTVEFADYTNFNVLGIFQKTTVTVYGR